MHRNGDKDLFKQMSEEMLLFDGDQVPEWRGVGDSSHPASMLARDAARRRLEQGRLAVQVGFVDHSQGNAVAAQEVFGLDAREPKHFRNLVERQSLLAIALQSDRL